MNALAKLDDHLRKLHVLQHRSVKVLDQFAEHSDSIATKADRIRREVRPYQVALANVLATKDEAEIAVTFHSIPNSVKEVLQKKNRDPTAIVAAITHLVSADEYLSSHGANSISEEMLDTVKKHITQIVKIAEERVTHAVVEAISTRNLGFASARDAAATPQRQTFGSLGSSNDFFASISAGGVGDAAGSTSLSAQLMSASSAVTGGGGVSSALGRKWHLIHHADALNDIEAIVKTLNTVFDRRNIVDDVKHLLVERVTAVLDGCFTASYREDYEASRGEDQDDDAPGAGDGTPRPLSASSAARRAGAAVKNYRRGQHPLLEFSAGARLMLSELSVLLKKIVLDPLENDFEIAGVISEIGVAVVQKIFSRALATTSISTEILFGNATRVFLSSGGTGFATAEANPGGPSGSDDGALTDDVLLSGSSHNAVNSGARVRDHIFVGLDLLSELWRWQQTASSLEGDTSDLVQAVDENLGKFIVYIRDILNAYSNAKGSLDADELLEFGKRGLVSWMPSTECAPHESTIGFLYFMKVLFTTYFGAMKIVMCEGIEEGVSTVSKNPIAQSVAMQCVQQFFTKCVEGHVQDIKAIGEAAVALQRHKAAEAEKGRLFSAIGAGAGSVASSSTVGDGVVVSPALFQLNNVCFLTQHLNQDECFQIHRLVADDDDDDADDADTTDHAAQQTRRRASVSDVELGEDEDDLVGDAEDLANSTRKKQRGDDEGADGNGQRPKPKKLGDLVVAEALQNLDAQKETLVTDDYSAEWLSCFPMLQGDGADPALDELVNEHGRDEPLTKKMREAVKRWYQAAASKVMRQINNTHFHSVWDARQKSALRDAARDAVEMGFEAMSNVLEDREWSTRPRRYLPTAVEDIIEQAANIY